MNAVAWLDGQRDVALRAIRYLVVLGLVAISFGIVGRLIYLDGYYYANAPRREDRARGAVIPVTVHHGARVFLTQDEWGHFESPTAFAIQMVVFGGAAAAASVLNRRWKILRSPGRG
jgi:hypothetical protein